MNKNPAFTLAEILITLTVIGVIAAISIPSLMTKLKNTELKNRLKTANAIVANAVKEMAAAEGGQLRSKYSKVAGSFKPEFMKYFNVLADHNSQDCTPPSYTSYTYKNYIKSGKMDESFLLYGQFSINNGMTILTYNPGPAIYELTVFVDTNGYQKAPNALGHDLFCFQVMSDDSLKPCGAPGTFHETDCNSSSASTINGLGCTASAINDENYWDNLP